MSVNISDILNSILVDKTIPSISRYKNISNLKPGEEHLEEATEHEESTNYTETRTFDINEYLEQFGHNDGDAQEFEIINIVNQMDNSKNTLFSNVRLNDKSEIDIVVVSDFGVFIIEVKDRLGSLKKGPDGIYLIHNDKKTNRLISFNLTKQLYNCKNTLSRELNIPQSKIFEAIVLSNKCKFQDNEFSFIMHPNKLRSWIECKTATEFTKEEKDIIIKNLSNHGYLWDSNKINIVRKSKTSFLSEYKSSSWKTKAYVDYSKINSYKYDSNGYDINGYDRNGINKYGKDKYGRFHWFGWHYKKNLSKSKIENRIKKYESKHPKNYNYLDDNSNELDSRGFDTYGFHYITRTKYDPDGYDKLGFDIHGYNKYGYDKNGFNKDRISKDTNSQWDKDGYDYLGYDKDGYDKNGYNDQGYDINGYNKFGYDKDGYNKKGFNKDHISRETNTPWSEDGYDYLGYDKQGYDKDGYNINGYNVGGFKRNGLDNEGYNVFGYNKQGFNRRGINYYTHTLYDKEGYDKDGYNKQGYDKNGYNVDGYNKFGYDKDGYDKNGYNDQGYDQEGYNKYNFNQEGIHKLTGTHYDPNGYDQEGYNASGYDKEGYDKKGYDKNGYNRSGYNCYGYDKEGFNKKGFNKQGFNKKKIFYLTGTKYDLDGYDINGYNKNGIKENGDTKPFMQKLLLSVRTWATSFVNTQYPITIEKMLSNWDAFLDASNKYSTKKFTKSFGENRYDFDNMYMINEVIKTYNNTLCFSNIWVNNSTEIDILLISKHGIFLIDTKDIDGRLVKSKSGDVYIKQPSKQGVNLYNLTAERNFKRDKISEILNISKSKIYTVTVVNKHCIFKEQIPSYICTEDIIKWLDSHKGKILDKEDICTICKSFETNKDIKAYYWTSSRNIDFLNSI